MQLCHHSVPHSNQLVVHPKYPPTKKQNPSRRGQKRQERVVTAVIDREIIRTNGKQSGIELLSIISVELSDTVNMSKYSRANEDQG